MFSYILAHGYHILTSFGTSFMLLSLWAQLLFFYLSLTSQITLLCFYHNCMLFVLLYVFLYFFVGFCARDGPTQSSLHMGLLRNISSSFVFSTTDLFALGSERLFSPQIIQQNIQQNKTVKLGNARKNIQTRQTGIQASKQAVLHCKRIQILIWGSPVE